MKHVTVILERDHDEQLAAAARALADLLGSDVATLSVGQGPRDHEREVLEALGADEDAVAIAVAVRDTDSLGWRLITHTHLPVLVVPSACANAQKHISHVLLPLDGSARTAAAVAAVTRAALDAGAQVRATHVFTPATVPAFWDQVAHTQQQWSREFLLRNLPGAVRLDLHRGGTTEQVLAEAAQSDVDLVVLGWSQDLAAGHADTVRHALTDSEVPVLLVGVAR